MGFTYFLSPGGGGSLRPLKSAVGVYCHRGSMSVGSSESPRPGPVLGWALASLELDLGGVCLRSGHPCPVSLSLSAVLASLPCTPHPSLPVPWPHSQHSDGPGTTVAPAPPAHDAFSSCPMDSRNQEADGPRAPLTVKALCARPFAGYRGDSSWVSSPLILGQLS